MRNGAYRPLPLLVENKFRVRSVCSVGTDQNKVHIRKNPVTAPPVIRRFQLVPQIGRLIVQKFHAGPAGKRVRKIYIAPHKGVQLLHTGHPLDMEAVDFFYQLGLLIRWGIWEK